MMGGALLMGFARPGVRASGALHAAVFVSPFVFETTGLMDARYSRDSNERVRPKRPLLRKPIRLEAKHSSLSAPAKPVGKKEQ
jgi:hypothetical protein